MRVPARAIVATRRINENDHRILTAVQHGEFVGSSVSPNSSVYRAAYALNMTPHEAAHAAVAYVLGFSFDTLPVVG